MHMKYWCHVSREHAASKARRDHIITAKQSHIPLAQLVSLCDTSDTFLYVVKIAMGRDSCELCTCKRQVMWFGPSCKKGNIIWAAACCYLRKCPIALHKNDCCFVCACFKCLIGDFWAVSCVFCNVLFPQLNYFMWWRVLFDSILIISNSRHASFLSFQVSSISYILYLINGQNRCVILNWWIITYHAIYLVLVRRVLLFGCWENSQKSIYLRFNFLLLNG